MCSTLQWCHLPNYLLGITTAIWPRGVTVHFNTYIESYKLGYRICHKFAKPVKYTIGPMMAKTTEQVQTATTVEAGERSGLRNAKLSVIVGTWA